MFSSYINPLAPDIFLVLSPSGTVLYLTSTDGKLFTNRKSFSPFLQKNPNNLFTTERQMARSSYINVDIITCFRSADIPSGRVLSHEETLKKIKPAESPNPDEYAPFLKGFPSFVFLKKIRIQSKNWAGIKDGTFRRRLKTSGISNTYV